MNLTYQEFSKLLNLVAHKALTSDGKSTGYLDLFTKLQAYDNAIPTSETIRLEDLEVEISIKIKKQPSNLEKS